MAFGNFTLQSVQDQFGLILSRGQPLFSGVRPVEAGPAIRHNLETFGPLALSVNTEKARSEWLIAPVLGEMWARAQYTVYVLSGVEFTVDKEAGLTGIVDFLIGRGPQLSYITSPPILTVVEAKNESIPGGQGQCAAEMVASQRFNTKSADSDDPVYGLVTTGSQWLFHRLRGRELAVDTREYAAAEVDLILGILLHIVGLNPVA